MDHLEFRCKVCNGFYGDNGECVTLGCSGDEEEFSMNWTTEDLKDPERQRIVFIDMLRTLEDQLKCKYVYHRLSEVLFGDSNDA
jgi:hypothetical protein